MTATLPARLRSCLPSWRAALGGAVLWGAAMGASAFAALSLDAWETSNRVWFVAGLFAAGGALAFPVALVLARLLAASRAGETRFAAAFVSFATVTIGLTAALYALQYRAYYAQWHADLFSVTWVLQLFFTGLAALYQFAVLGVRLFFPLGFICLLAVSVWFARRPR